MMSDLIRERLLAELIKSERWELLAVMSDRVTDEEFTELTKAWSVSAREAARTARTGRGEKRVSENFKKVFAEKGFDKAVYKSLTSRDRENVLTEATKGFKENYIPKASTPALVRAFKPELSASKMGELVSLNKQVGVLEGKRRAFMKRAGENKGKEKRKWLSMVISTQSKATRLGKQMEQYVNV